MTTDKKFKIKAGILCLFITITLSMKLKGQEDFNNSKSWGVSADFYYNPNGNTYAINLLYKYKKSVFFAGYGRRYTNYEPAVNISEPDYFLGFRRYPTKNVKPIKFFYQGILYYTSNQYKEPYISNKYLTCVGGLGIQYDFLKKLSCRLSSHAGAGYNFTYTEIVYTYFPVNISLTYLF